MSAAAGTSRPFPWDAAMAAGLGLLRLSPDAFWAMTPRELDMALGWWRPPVGASPGRGGLEALMAVFPDTRSNDDG